ncbi:MAG: arginine deiminase [Clostridiales bacterium]|jgi:arginine deiminase|nr:arginine deiminase [Clostridiales bacterium]
MNNYKNTNFLNVTSEIGNLKAVLLHKPGKELERLTPEYLRELLFDDIPWLKKMKQEHDEFARVLKDRGTLVYYIEDLLAEVLSDKDVKEDFVKRLLKHSRIENPNLNEMLYDYIISKGTGEIVEIAIGGLNKKDVPYNNRELSLTDYIYADYPLYINPLPNLYFMRDPAAVMGKGISINSMHTAARAREPILIRYIYEYNPLFKKESAPLWYDYSIPFSMEGGDMLVLSREVVAIGCSERTSAEGIEIIAKNLFEGVEEIKEVVVVRIPALRAFMHLDTVFTMIDYDKFTIYPGIQDKVEVYRLIRGKNNNVTVKHEDELVDTLRKVLKIPTIRLIESGGGDPVTAAREQWNDSTNTLAIAPGVVVTYSRNEFSNEVLRQNGIEVLEIEGSELVRGRGGPRCMSMPLVREEI